MLNQTRRAMGAATKIAEITAAIARSPIVRAPAPRHARRLPAGFDEVDVAILEWIAAEGRARRTSLLGLNRHLA